MNVHLFHPLAAVAVISAATLAGQSRVDAADLARPIYKAPSVEASYDWSGFYVGGHAGWAQLDREFATTTIFSTVTNPGFNQSADGFLGGFQTGFNRQFGNWLWGLEAELSFGNLDSVTTVATPVSQIKQTYDVGADWLATFAGRVGFVSDRWMVYAKGGVAAMRETYMLSASGLVLPDSPYQSMKTTRIGWLVGAGFEHAITDRWSWKVEYNYLQFDDGANISNNLSGFQHAGILSYTQDELHIVKAGLNYRLGSEANVARPAGIYKSQPASHHSWAGIYVGGHAAWASVDRSFQAPRAGVVDLYPAFDQSADGFGGGVQAGYNYQQGHWVLGVEADVTALSADATSVVTSPNGIFTYDVGVDWVATLTGRVGYAWDRWLVYAKGGAAFGHETYNMAASIFAPRAGVHTGNAGWTFGVGVEGAIANGWSWRAEYDYLRFDNVKVTNPSFLATAGGTSAQTDSEIHLVKLGLNYNFGNSR
jgi:opacity protein-like surface antigen